MRLRFRSLVRYPLRIPCSLFSLFVNGFLLPCCFFFVALPYLCKVPRRRFRFTDVLAFSFFVCVSFRLVLLLLLGCGVLVTLRLDDRLHFFPLEFSAADVEVNGVCVGVSVAVAFRQLLEFVLDDRDFFQGVS